MTHVNRIMLDKRKGSFNLIKRSRKREVYNQFQFDMLPSIVRIHVLVLLVYTHAVMLLRATFHPLQLTKGMLGTQITFCSF